MTDAELIARLREGICDWPEFDYDRTEAADRIEALTAKLATCEKYRDAYAECERIGTQAVRDLEAKLAKAVEALEFYTGYDDGPIARATLAEIKGENHE